MSDCGYFNDAPPDHVNAEGVKWWVHHSLTDYAISRTRIIGKPLPGAVVFIAQRPDGYREYVLTRNGQYIAADSALEGIGAAIDMARSMASGSTLGIQQRARVLHRLSLRLAGKKRTAN